MAAADPGLGRVCPGLTHLWTVQNGARLYAMSHLRTIHALSYSHAMSHLHADSQLHAILCLHAMSHLHVTHACMPFCICMPFHTCMPFQPLTYDMYTMLRKVDMMSHPQAIALTVIPAHKCVCTTCKLVQRRLSFSTCRSCPSL